MRAEILCVGTELLLGDIVNTNAAYIAKELAAIGVDVYYQTVVGDNNERLEESLNLAFSRADIVIMTGGLGPTYDDLTKETVAKYFNVPMEVDQASLDSIRGFFKKIGAEMTKNNEKQALMPKGATVFHNNWGTAPGLALTDGKLTAILLPGPPGEMKPMFAAYVIDYLSKMSNKVLVSKNIRLFGIGESKIEDMLHDYMKSSSNPTIAPYAKIGEAMLRVTASGKDKEECEKLIAPVIKKINEILGDYIYGIDIPNLQYAVVEELKEKGLKVATAESCTGGMLSEFITSMPGSSTVFDCGVCSYANNVKSKLLGVRDSTLEKYGAVSEQTAAEMAAGIRAISGADIGVSTTGIAGPDGGTPEKPVGTVYIGIDSENDRRVIKLNLSGRRSDNERYMVRYRSAQNALFAVLETIRKHY